MWIVVYMARSRELAENLKALLQDGEVLVKIKPVIKSSDAQSCYEVLVPESEVGIAHDIIIDAGL